MTAYRVPSNYTAAQLLLAIQTAKREPGSSFSIAGSWPAEEMTAAQYIAWFRSCMNAKINRGQAPRGRKDCSDWQRDAMRTARSVNTPRLRVYLRSVPLEFRARLAHRLVDPREDW